MKKKIMGIILGSSTGLIAFFLILIIPLLMLLDFFGVNIDSSDFIENNMEYAEDYKAVLNKYLTINDPLGYVPLSRILYFWIEDNSLSWDDIYKNNLDPDTKSLIPITDVCLLHYKYLQVCKSEELEDSGQTNDYIVQPFNVPLDFNLATITSYFKEERIVFDNYGIHNAWDLGASANTPVYSIGEGTVIEVSFNYTENITDINGGGGNYIKIKYVVNDIEYIVTFAHLYPNSSLVKVDDTVTGFQKIAEVGTTGYSTGNHLHFEISVNGNVIDGLALIDFNLINEPYSYNPILN